MSDVQHKELFIMKLVAHIRMSLMQHKIATQSKALEIAIKLEASRIGKNVVGLNQIQKQLENLTLQWKDIKKCKEHYEEVWFNRYCS